MAKKFTGELAERIDPPKLGLLNLNGHNEKELDRVFNTKIKKLSLLASHYNIPIDDKMPIALALRMAEEFIPGFHEKKIKGPSKKWDDMAYAVLYVEVERMKEGKNKQKGVSWVTKILSNKEPWKSFLENDSKQGGTNIDPGESLRKAYYKGKNREWSEFYYDFYKKMLEIDRIKGNSDKVNEWERNVFEYVNNKK